MVARPQPSEEHVQALAKRRLSGYFQRIEAPSKVRKLEANMKVQEIVQVRETRGSVSYQKVDKKD